MNPVPPELDPLNIGPDWEIWKPRLHVPEWLRNNPGLVFSALYLLLSVIGLLYQFLFFRRFQLNVLEFSDATDFLMVVVRDPLTVAMASLGLFFYMGYIWVWLRIARWCYRRWPKLRQGGDKLIESREKARKMVPGAQVMFIATYAVLFSLLYSVWQSNRARAGEFPQVTVQLASGAVASPTPFTATLLGTTSRFLFFYRPETKRAEAVPVEAIAQLSWDARRRRERAAESPKAPAEPAQAPAPASVPAPATPGGN